MNALSKFIHQKLLIATAGPDVDPFNFYLEVGSVVMKRVLLMSITGALGWWIYSYLSNNTQGALYSELPTLFVLTGCYREIYYKRLKNAIFLMAWGIWIMSIFRGFFVAGINTPILISIPCVIMLLAWIQGPRVAALVAALSFFLLGTIVYLQINGSLPAPAYRSPTQFLITYYVVIATSGTIAIALGQNLKRLVKRDRQLSIDLQEKVTALGHTTASLNLLNEQLELKVTERTRQFEQSNAELTQVHAKLERAQLELVKTETLSSMASIVAGISHELNTPIGNALLINSRLEQDFQTMAVSFELGNIKRSDLKSFLESGKNACEISVKSNQRAADLINKFKAVGIDQIAEQRRLFDLSDLIANSIQYYRTSSQHLEVNIINAISKGIEVDSFPGALGFIINCLLQNAIIHGFGAERRGTVTFDAVRRGDFVDVSISDNGVGMGPAISAHAFDPFFTTHFGKGRVGLGLSVSYRIATSILRGNLSVRSTPNIGSTFVLSCPLKTPIVI
jgi:signal transduction histidine kinase